MLQRIDKILSENNLLSRSMAKKAAKQRRITVNGVVVASAEIKIDDSDTLALDGSIVERQRFVYIMLNKPMDYVCSNDDPKSPIVFELIDQKDLRRGLFTVGRLDKNTTGLLILTNDGALAHGLLSPKNDICKTYAVRLKHPLRGDEGARFAAGVLLEDGTPTKPAVLDGAAGDAVCRLTISEGKFHQVKRMFDAVGNKVVALCRISFAGLTLDSTLCEGEYRMLTQSEVQNLKNLL